MDIVTTSPEAVNANSSGEKPTGTVVIHANRWDYLQVGLGLMFKKLKQSNGYLIGRHMLSHTFTTNNNTGEHCETENDRE